MRATLRATQLVVIIIVIRNFITWPFSSTIRTNIIHAIEIGILIQVVLMIMLVMLVGVDGMVTMMTTMKIMTMMMKINYCNYGTGQIALLLPHYYMLQSEKD